MNAHDLNQAALRVADVAIDYARRRGLHIDHTGHTEHRLIEAVEALIGKKLTVVAAPKPVSAMGEYWSWLRRS